MNWRRLLIGVAMYSTATLMSVFAQTSQTNSGGKLVFLNWPDYMDPAVLEAFTQETGIAVQEVYFESDDLRDDMVAEHNGQGYDLVCLNELGLESYHRQWLVGAYPGGPYAQPQACEHGPDHVRNAVTLWRADLLGNLRHRLSFRPGSRTHHHLATTL